METAASVLVQGRRRAYQATVRHSRTQAHYQRPGGGFGRRGPAPDVDGAAIRLRDAAQLAQLRGTRGDGLRLPRRGGRRGVAAQRPGRRCRRRRRLPDVYERASHGQTVRHPGQNSADQQRIPGHGAPVAGAVLRASLLAQRHGGRAGFREARGGLQRASAASEESERSHTHTGEGIEYYRTRVDRNAGGAGGECLSDRAGRGGAEGYDSGVVFSFQFSVSSFQPFVTTKQPLKTEN